MNFWELSDPEVPTYKAGTVTDGVLLALGEYRLVGVLPQAVQPEIDVGYPAAHPVFVTASKVLADHHARDLDVITQTVEQMPPTRRCNIRTVTAEHWAGSNL